MTAAITIPTAISAPAPMVSMVDPLLRSRPSGGNLSNALVFGATEGPCRAARTDCRQGDWRLRSVGGYVAGSEPCLNGPGGPMMLAVNTKSGIRYIRNLLVFFVARGPFVR